jgi:maleylpyruvate isomerase
VNSGIQPHQNLLTTRKLKSLGIDDQAWPKPYIASGLAAFEALVIDTWTALGHGQRNILFSAGDVPTIADCCLVPQLASARRFHVELDPAGPLAQLLEIERTCLALPAFAPAMPDQQHDAVK